MLKNVRIILNVFFGCNSLLLKNNIFVCCYVKEIFSYGFLLGPWKRFTTFQVHHNITVIFGTMWLILTLHEYEKASV